MQHSRFLSYLALTVAPVAFIGTIWLYLYPLFDTACSFPEPVNATAPFRLLALGDPQLEGDSSLPKTDAPIFRSLGSLTEHLQEADSLSDGCRLVVDALRGVPIDLVRAAEGYIRKPLDIWGNDWYLAHIVRTLRWWTRPSHVAVLGDLLGSQWVSDDEFARRSRRYWGTVFKGMVRVPTSITGGKEDKREHEEGGVRKQKRWGGTVEQLGDDPAWSTRVINIAGNHDIGYAGDIDDKRIERFEDVFGSVNWDVVFTLPGTDDSPNAPALRLVILNSMNLDTPAYAEHLQRETYDFINHIITTSRSVTDKTHATILLTHIPLHKEAGVCVDAPLFHYFDGGGIKEQNMLSEYSSKMMLESIFGLNSNQHALGNGFGRRGIIINGHDHAGCDVLHYITQPGIKGQCPENIGEHEIHLPSIITNTTTSLSVGSCAGNLLAANGSIPEPDREDENRQWQAQRFPHLPYKANEDGECIALHHVPRMREVTLRSMMGEFSGYAGFLSAWFDPSLGERGEWRLELNTCGLGVQHWWWAVHIIDIVLVLVIVARGLVAFSEISQTSRVEDTKKKSNQTD